MRNVLFCVQSGHLSEQAPTWSRRPQLPPAAFPTPETETPNSNTTTMSDPFSGIDIGAIIREEGTIVKAVLLRCSPAKNDASTSTNAAAPPTAAVDREISTMSISDIKSELDSYGVDGSTFVEKNELVKALEVERSNRKVPAKEVLEVDAVVAKAAAARDVQPVTQDDTEKRSSSNYTTQEDVLLSHLIEQIEIDTTPKKSMVAKVLGGEFTFIGQYEDEGIMVMARVPTWENGDSSDDDEEDDGNTGATGGGDSDNNEDIPPINPHKLQPPLHKFEVRGDILLMRVAETEEELDEEFEEQQEAERMSGGGDDDGKPSAKEDGDGAKPAAASDGHGECSEEKKIHVPTNDEFFLDYTKEEYLKFAARTDIEYESPEEESETEEEVVEEEMEGEDPFALLKALTAGRGGDDESGDDENDEDFDPEAEEIDFDSEEQQIGMMNLILGQILRRFHEENGRGPNTLEVLEMRKALADRLGVAVPAVDEEACNWDNKVPTPKKHNKKVVVAEEKNECETIPRANDGTVLCEPVDEEAGFEVGTTANDNDEKGEEDSDNLKRPAVAVKSEEDDSEKSPSKKKAKVEEGNKEDS